MHLLTSSVLTFLALTSQSFATELWARQSTTTTGDRTCMQVGIDRECIDENPLIERHLQTMCVSATVNGSTIDYTLSSTGANTVGWMGVGFGQQMTNSPMVIMWSNSDGSITLSQREASAHVMPTVVNNPPRVATLEQSLSSTSSNNVQYAFSIPANGDTTQDIVFAFGTTNPGSAAVDASLQQHIETGIAQLDLTRQSDSSTSGNTTPPNQASSGTDMPLLPYQRLIVVHAIFCVVGFLVFLPAGALIARYLRTFTPTWFSGHWILQFALAGSTIVIGFALGVQAVNQAGVEHLDDRHKVKPNNMRLGVALFVLYFAQCGLGAIIHRFKPKGINYRPPQNYFHAIFGIFIVALALYQVRIGYNVEWPKATGRAPLPNGVDIIFWIWVALLPLSYGLGLGFLKKQYRQEREARQAQGDKDYGEE
ncbi:hypothetical protein NP233_g9019 [Leucocoprinus birnbaumii]|uniref:CBD9-like protein n=1 Tax=Leucocoprinus birnbaumii TaxID=56174 RepID=A0AAD5VL78_9AGAR|nr:hypothetical protein NP233_g9019 [Leucocoprinus birnbaumii]